MLGPAQFKHSMYLKTHKYNLENKYKIYIAKK